MIVDLIGVKLAAELKRVRIDSSRAPLAEVIGIVHLGQVGDRHTHDKGRKRDVFHAFILGRLNDNAGGTLAGSKALGRKTHPETPVWLTDDVSVEQIANMKLINRTGANHFRTAERQELRAADKQCVEAGDAGSCDRTRIRIVEAVVVYKVITRELAQSTVAVDTHGTLVVPHRLRKGRG